MRPAADDCTHPVGEKKPNDLGLFDVYGNALEWCHDAQETPAPGAQLVPAEIIGKDIRRLLKGSSFINHSSALLSAQWTAQLPESRGTTMGLRVARTLP
jgi:formylglycine-generating enzyme required for sulfatase activity